jgi:hypothetical protein
MKSRKNFLIYLSAFAIIVIAILAFVFSEKKLNEKPSLEEVDYTRNILKNPSFETGDLKFWDIGSRVDKSSYVLVDDIVKFDGNYSLNFTSESDTEFLSVSQIIKPIPRDQKIVFNARIRTEDVKEVFIRMKLYSSKDSLIVEAVSDTLKETNDWTFITTWLRTISPDVFYLKVECCMSGKGRVWFDKLEVFPIEIKERGLFPIRLK